MQAIVQEWSGDPQRGEHELHVDLGVLVLPGLGRCIDPAWRGERIRDVIAAREVVIEINRLLYEGLADRGASLDDVLDENDLDRTTRIFNSMPSFDVSVSLKTAYHRNPAHKWKPNHIQDIDALASTVPYCDGVVTDKEAASHLKSTGLAGRFHTAVLARVEDLIPALDSAAS